MVPKGTPIKAMGIMDAWKGGRIIYAYLIWVVFKTATAGGLYGEYTFGYLDSSRISGDAVVGCLLDKPENSYAASIYDLH